MQLSDAIGLSMLIIKISTDRQDCMGAPPRCAPIDTRVPPFAPPRPIYPSTSIFARVGVFAFKRGGGRGDSDSDGQRDGQTMRSTKTGLPKEKIGKVKSLPRFSFILFFGNRPQKFNPKIIIGRCFEPLTRQPGGRPCSSRSGRCRRATRPRAPWR